MELYKTSDTPLAAMLLAMGHTCVTKGLNSHNGRVWFGFNIDPDLAADIEDQWMNPIAEDREEGIHLFDLEQIHSAFQLKTNLVRITKGGQNDDRFTSKDWKEYYKADG